MATEASAGGDPLVGVVVDGRYRVVRRIARGGMATVYLASDTRLDRDVALKVMHPHLAQDPDFVARFHREAVAAARVAHPGVVAVFDQGRDDGAGPDGPRHGVVYLVLEHVPGSTLRDLLAAEGALTAGTALAVLEPVLDALAAAHRAGVVHRDVKPENVLLTDDGRVKVADFGLARAASSQTSTHTTGVLMGTVAYLSPELVTRGTADARSDVYAAGITLFEMLTGSQPFTGEVPIHVAHQHVTRDVPVPSTLVATVPQELDDLVLWMTARDPQDRPTDARELVHEVRALRRDLPDAVQDAAPRRTGRAPERGAGGAVAAVAGGAAAAAVVSRTTALPVRHEHVAALPVGEQGAPAAGAWAGEPGTSSTAALPRRSSPTPPAGLPAPRRRRRRGRLVATVVGAVVVVLLAAGAAWAALLGPWSQVTVPATQGMDRASAEQVLQDEGLASEVSERFDEQVPAGTVIGTNPAEGVSASRDAVVQLFLSRGSEFSLVPDLVGRPVGEARGAVEQVQLTLAEQSEAYDEQVPEGAVVSQEPAGGQQLRRGEAVQVVVSLGREPIDVPDVVGRTRGEAVSALQERGLRAVVTEEFDDDVAAGRVVRQDPDDDETRFRGDDVTVVVSLGPDLVEVPDVIGDQVDDATEELEDAGFQVEVDEVLGGLFGTVRDQSVEAGTQARPGTTITLTVV
ncbi:Stk1 family PASTA domain-containing Ser/Thr kinase [Pseudokineococcus sp. 1T1Z-3]|uniref:Stk1 family PASTA domain-containing Ser/Thr kinase n=1 Tax=Pseudokineococcus sp. 1T1Z-3 TaxID=3132745 RepID=UPI0030B7B34B